MNYYRFPSYIETLLMDEYGWSTTDFSYVISAAYYTAMVVPFITPYTIYHIFNGNLLSALIFFQSIGFLVGAILFAISIIFDANLIIVYTSRVIIGIGWGGTDSLIITILIFWFGKSNISTASACIIIAAETGLIIGRLCMEDEIFSNT